MIDRHIDDKRKVCAFVFREVHDVECYVQSYANNRTDTLTLLNLWIRHARRGDAARCHACVTLLEDTTKYLPYLLFGANHIAHNVFPMVHTEHFRIRSDLLQNPHFSRLQVLWLNQRYTYSPPTPLSMPSVPSAPSMPSMPFAQDAFCCSSPPPTLPSIPDTTVASDAADQPNAVFPTAPPTTTTLEGTTEDIINLAQGT